MLYKCFTQNKTIFMATCRLFEITTRTAVPDERLIPAEILSYRNYFIGTYVLPRQPRAKKSWNGNLKSMKNVLDTELRFIQKI